MQQDNCSRSCLLTPNAFPVCIASSAGTGVCFLLGVPTNLAALVILARRLKEKSFTIRLMLSLAVSDLLTLLPLPLWTWAALSSWIFGSALCKIFAYIEYWCIYCSALCVTLMSVQRYFQVLHPHKWAKVGARGENCLLFGIWILSGALCSYAPVQYNVGCVQSGFQDCYQTFRNDAEQMATSVIEVLVFVMCFFLLGLFYGLLCQGVHRSPFFSSNRGTKLVTRIVVAFFILYVLVPVADIFSIVALLLENPSLSAIADLCGTMARVLTILNSCINPFLYAFALRKLHSSRSLRQKT